jgi:hypothetical protein
MRTYVGLAIAVGLLIPVAATAQEAGHAGITMGYPGSVGLLYHVSERVAVRPEFTVSTITSSSISTVVSTGSRSWAFGVGASALFYFAKRDNVRPYVSPRFTYLRTSTTFESGNLLGSPAVSTSNHADGYSASGSVGAQYSPNDRFGVFGEVGFGYARTNGTSGTASKSTSDSWSTRTGAGVVLYF